MSSRWRALELSSRDGSAAPKSAPDAVSTSHRLAPALGARAWLPPRRGSLGHVRRMAIFFRQLHTLIRAGFPLAQACRELGRTAPWPLRPLAHELLAEVEAGRPLSQGLARHPELVSPWQVGLLRAAEAAGALPEALDQIAHAFEVEWETRSALLARLWFYGLFGLPILLLALPGILVLSQPIPEEGWTLPALFRFLRHSFLTVSLPIGAAIAGLVLVWSLLGSVPALLALQHRLVARLPGVGGLSRASALERYLGTLGLLLRAGLPIAEASELAALAAGHAALTPRLLGVVEPLREGVPLSQALAATGVLEADTLGVIASGEAAGALPETLSRSATLLRQELEHRRRLALRMAGVGIGVLWLAVAGGLVVFAVRSYIGFLLRFADWLGLEW